MKTPHAQLVFAGRGHYAEVQPALNRTYSCCCYGEIEIENNASGTREAQQTSYHEARIITAAGDIGPAPYDVPLNHYDDSNNCILKNWQGVSRIGLCQMAKLIFFNPEALPK